MDELLTNVHPVLFHFTNVVWTATSHILIPDIVKPTYTIVRKETVNAELRQRPAKGATILQCNLVSFGVVEIN